MHRWIFILIFCWTCFSLFFFWGEDLYLTCFNKKNIRWLIQLQFFFSDFNSKKKCWLKQTILWNWHHQDAWLFYWPHILFHLIYCYIWRQNVFTHISNSFPSKPGFCHCTDSWHLFYSYTLHRPANKTNMFRCWCHLFKGHVLFLLFRCHYENDD